MENAARSSTATMRDATVRDDSRLRRLRARLWRSVSPQCLAGRNLAGRSLAGRSLAGRSLAGALAVAVLSLGALSAARAGGLNDGPVKFVDPNTLLSLPGFVTFDTILLPAKSTDNGTINYNGVLYMPDYSLDPTYNPVPPPPLSPPPAPNPSISLGFAERFVGQGLTHDIVLPDGTIILNSGFDVLTGSPTNPLTLLPGVDGQNLSFYRDGMRMDDPPYTLPANLGGLGRLGFPDYRATGEGAIAVLFPRDQSALSFFMSGDDDGPRTVDFFRRDGSLIQSVTWTGNDLINEFGPDGYNWTYSNFYGFKTDTPDIAALTITNNDPNGLGLNYIRYNIPPPGVPILGRWWDGATTALDPDGAVRGGPGVWNATNVNWTLQDGSSNNAWPQSGTAIFAGQAGGLVTVEGEQTIGGLSFLAHDYHLQGGSLRLFPNLGPTPPIGSEVIINVEQNASARIDSVLTDMDRIYALVKNGPGTLELWGDNRYSGGTTLWEGVLGVGNNNALGVYFNGPGDNDGAADLDMNGGATLRALAPDLALDNPIFIFGGAGTIDTQAFTLTLNSSVGGAGAERPGTLTKTGSGRLILAYTGFESSNPGAVDVQQGALENRGILNPGAMTLSGENTRLINRAGASVSVNGGAGVLTGGAGAQFVENFGAIDIPVNLGGGADSYVLQTTGAQTGAADGGAGTDYLQIETLTGAERILQPGAFVNFETIDLNKEAANTGKFVIAGGAGPNPDPALDAGPSGGALTIYRGWMQLQDATSAVRAGTVAIAPDALLSGIGTVFAGTGPGQGLIVNGTISPGNSIGAMNVVGNYIQNGTYNLEFRAPAPGVAPVAGVDNDLIRVIGVATINDGAAFHLFPLSAAADYSAALTAANNPTPGKLRYTVIQTTGGMNAGKVSLLGFSGATVEKVGNDLQLVLSADNGGGGTNGGPRSGLLVNRAPAALALVLPQDAQFGCRGSLLGRNTIGYNEVRREEGCVWADGYAQLGGVKGVSGGDGGADPWSVAGARYTTGGFAFGGDRALSPTSFAGGSFTFGNTTAHFGDTIASHAQRGFHGALYAAFDDGVWNAGLSAGYSHYAVDTTRNTRLETNPTARASYDMRQYRIGAVARRIFQLSDTWWALPEARFNWEPLTRNAFAETLGGDANFHSAAAQWNIAKLGAGLILRHRPDWLPTWTAEVELGWRRLLGDTALPLRGVYQGAPGDVYQTSANAYQRDSVSVRGALTNRVSDRLSVVANYAGQFNAQRYDNLFNLMVRQQF